MFRSTAFDNRWFQMGLLAIRRLWLLAALLLLSIATINSAWAKPSVVLVVGDSLSAEYGLSRGSGWVALLEKRLQEKRVDYSVVNASISGETSSGGASRIEALLIQHKPQVVVLELGGNDGLRGLSLDATRANFEKMIRAAQATKARVLIAGMRLPPNYGRDYTERFFAMYGELARAHKTALVPFFLEGVGEKRELFQADGIHPKAEAHPVILENVWPTLQPLLSAKAKR
jgi:acyl-CoA thioesterase I